MQVIDIFCGAGGFSEGFRQQGFEIISGIDHWQPAIDTFNYNFGLNCRTQDVLEFENSIESIEKIPDTEIIIGSPPCVSFSNSNKSGKADKSLGLKLIKIFLRIITVKKYKKRSILKAWFMENVTNSKVHLPKEYSFESLNLRDWALNLGLNPKSTAISLVDNQIIINSADFGTPQIRLRVFTGEITKKNKPVILKQTYKALNQKGRLPTHITLGYIKNSFPKPNSKFSTSSIVIDPLYSSLKIKQSELSDHFYDTGLYTLQWKGSKFLKTNHPYMGKMSFPEKEDRPSRTITATKIGNSRESIIYKSEYRRKGNGEFRTPTIREAATLMGFPITYQFIGSENSKWRLVGNAVCPPVSRALARFVREVYKLEIVSRPKVVKILTSLEQIPNLNTYKIKRFDKPPIRKHGSRFRRHPFKDGNLTVTLSNYDIKKNEKSQGEKWYTSIQYGTGFGFPIQSFPDGYFKELETIINEFEGGAKFIQTINNGFSKKVPNSKTLQEIYESQTNTFKHLGPIELVDGVGELIEAISMKEPNFIQNNLTRFQKNIIPKKQVLALYALNRICTIVNGEKK